MKQAESHGSLVDVVFIFQAGTQRTYRYLADIIRTVQEGTYVRKYKDIFCIYVNLKTFLIFPDIWYEIEEPLLKQSTLPAFRALLRGIRPSGSLITSVLTRRRHVLLSCVARWCNGEVDSTKHFAFILRIEALLPRVGCLLYTCTTYQRTYVLLRLWQLQQLNCCAQLQHRAYESHLPYVRHGSRNTRLTRRSSKPVQQQ